MPRWREVIFLPLVIFLALKSPCLHRERFCDFLSISVNMICLPSSFYILSYFGLYIKWVFASSRERRLAFSIALTISAFPLGAQTFPM